MSSASDAPPPLRDRWPALAVERRWRNVTVYPFVLSGNLPPVDDIQSVNMVAFDGDVVHIPVMADGSVLLPGGTREIGETPAETLEREMDEELGAVVKSAHLLGYWPCFSSDAEPWRPHLSHPRFLRVVFYGEVELVRPPANPDDGERIESIRSLPSGQAVDWLRSSNRPELADLHDLAAAVRSGIAVDPNPNSR